MRTTKLINSAFLSAFLWLGACNPVVNFFAFHPNDSYILEAEYLPSNTTEVFLKTDDGVHVLALYLNNPSVDTVTIFFHGNAGNVYHRLNDLQHLRQLGTSVLAVSYRGYAKSEGSPSEAGIYRDAYAAFDYVTGELGVPQSRIFVFGRSIGSTAATNLAQNKDIAGLILVSPMTNGRDMASVMGLGFAASLTGNAFENDKKIKHVKAPLLIVHGSRDTLIPISMGRKLFDAAKGRKVFYEVKDAGHNDLTHRFADRYWKAVSDFLRNPQESRHSPPVHPSDPLDQDYKFPLHMP